MDKVKKILEGYVEWLAIALGVGFLGWMIYGYVLEKPVSSSVGSNPSVSPAEVDPLVWDGIGQQIKGEIDSKAVAPMPPIADWTVTAHDSFAKVSPSVLPVFPGSYTPLTPSSDADVAVVPSHVNLPNHVTQLPEAPTLQNLQVSAGHSNVPAPVVAAADGTTPPPPAANAAQAIDKNWRTIGATLSTADLAKSFAACKIPDMFCSTAILRVTLVRQERDGSGNWGPETQIPPLETNVLQDLPANNASGNDQINYIAWAEKNVEMIVAPKFYNVLQGDIWYEPGTKSPNQVDVAVVDDGFDPKNPSLFKGDPNTLTPDEKKEYDKYLADQARRQAARQRGANNRNAPQQQQLPPGFGPGGFNGGGRGGPGGSPAVPDPQRDAPSSTPHDFFPGANGGPPPGMMPPGMMPPGMMPGMESMPGGPGNSINTTLPQGSFNPATQANIKVWAHDATVQPGKIYRYKLRYIISNPVGRTMGLCVPQALAEQFYIASKDSVWTDPVSVESDTNFYAVDTKHGVRFDIFKWKNGVYQMQTVQVNPGDMIGSVDTSATNTDFTTHWTLVDVREDPRDETNKTIVLVSDNGTVLKKELVIDQHSAAYRRLLEQANANKTAQAGPGTPPG